MVNVICKRFKIIAFVAFVASVSAETATGQNYAAGVAYGEMAYLHLDRDAYFLGDSIRFAATVVNTSGNADGVKSRVLYVDLLAPEGYAVATKKYRIKDGRCGGSVALPPSILSGLYEIRAYTRFMAASDVENYFTRVVPVYDRTDDGGRTVVTIYDRKRKVRDSLAAKTGPLKQRTDKNATVGSLCVDYDKARLKPFGLVRLRLKGEPGCRVSVSVTDAVGCISGAARADMADFMAAVKSRAVKQTEKGAPDPETEITAAGTVTSTKFKFLKGPQRQPQSGVRLAYTMNGKNGAAYGSTVTDSLGRFHIRLGDTPGGTLTLRYDKSLYDKTLRIAVDKWFAPRPRAYTAEEQSLTRAGRADVAVVKPLRSSHIGLTHSCIHTTVADEAEWAAAFTDYDFYKNQRQRGSFITCLKDHWAYPIVYPTRIVSVKAGQYPGDGGIPKAKWIFDNYEFDINDYDTIIIRTDSAVCEAYAFNETSQYAKPIYTYPGTGQSSHNPIYIRHFSGYSKPAIVIFLIEKSDSAKLSTPPLGALDHLSTRVDGFSPAGHYINPNYSCGHPATDSRSLLYWNPDITLDANGETTVEFYNNSSCKQLVISAEGITEDGQAVVYKANK